MTEEIIKIENLIRRFGKTTALNNVSLHMPEGIVLGLVGENGAGKTTLIKHILGLLRAKEGTVRVFGKDPVAHPEYVLSRLGYLSENREDLPGWMRIQELFRYTQAFYPKWDHPYSLKLCETFGLDPAQKIKTLSKGQRAQVGLINALAHRPELLLLDEPSSGLDPVVRHDLLATVIQSVAEEGRSVFFSSHLLEEIEQVSSRVVMMHKGKVYVDSPLADIQNAYCYLELGMESFPVSPPALPGMIWSKRNDSHWNILCKEDMEKVKQRVTESGTSLLQAKRPSLNEIFVSLVKDDWGR